MRKRTRGRMGRPPKPPAERRVRNITVHVTHDELKRIDKDAKRLGMNRSDLLMQPWRGKEKA